MSLTHSIGAAAASAAQLTTKVALLLACSPEPALTFRSQDMLIRLSRYSGRPAKHGLGSLARSTSRVSIQLTNYASQFFSEFAAEVPSLKRTHVCACKLCGGQLDCELGGEFVVIERTPSPPRSARACVTCPTPRPLHITFMGERNRERDSEE